MAKEGETEAVIYYDKESDFETLQKRAKTWIGDVLKEELPDHLSLGELLADGLILKQLGQRTSTLYRAKFGLLPGEKCGADSPKSATKVPRVLNRGISCAKWGTKMHWDSISNVDSFLKVCRDVGVKDVHMFSPTDVVDQKNLKSVCLCLRAFASRLNSMGLVAREFEPTMGSLAQANSASSAGQHVESVVRNMDMGVTSYPSIRARASGNSSEEDYDFDSTPGGSGGEEQGEKKGGGKRGEGEPTAGVSANGHCSAVEEEQGSSSKTEPRVLGESNGTPAHKGPDKGSKGKAAGKEGRKGGESGTVKKHRRRKSVDAVEEEVGKRPSSGHKENGMQSSPSSEFKAMRITPAGVESSKGGPGAVRPFVLSASISPSTPSSAASKGQAALAGAESAEAGKERRRRPKPAGEEAKAGAASTPRRRGSANGKGTHGRGSKAVVKHQKSLLEHVAGLPIHVLAGGAMAATFALGALAMFFLRPKKEYRVKPGDCLANIAQKAGKRDWKEIHKQNPKIRDPNFILSEDVIRI